jgi:hypothetical protein
VAGRMRCDAAATRWGEWPGATGQSRCDGWVRASMMGGRESWSEWPLSRCGCRAIHCTSATVADDVLDRWQAWARVGEAELAWEGAHGRCACSREECVGAEAVVMTRAQRGALMRIGAGENWQVCHGREREGGGPLASGPGR